MSSAVNEGNRTNEHKGDHENHSLLENKVEETLELNGQPPRYPYNANYNSVKVQPQYQSQPTQIVVIPQQNANYPPNNNNNNIIGSGMVISNTQYFQPRSDIGNYDEDMKPWQRDGQQYGIACCTEYIDPVILKRLNGNTQNAERKWINTVYHKEGTNRLIIKMRVQPFTTDKVKSNPLAKYGAIVILVGIILLAVGASQDETAMIIIGVLLILFSFGLCFGGCNKTKLTIRDLETVTQSIPIDSIFYVSRKVSTTSSTMSNNCTCCTCCTPAEEKGIEYSDISIGYNRSNLSTKFQANASLEDFVTIRLEANQAFNLHQYINSIVDGTHPQIAQNGIGADSLLPRYSQKKHNSKDK